MPIVGLLGLVGLVASVLASCGSTGEPATPAAPAPTTAANVDLSGVTLRIGDQKGGSKALLAASGLLDNTPYELTWSEFTSGPPLLEALNAGSIDIGGVGDTPPIFAQSSGVPFKIVGAYQVTPVGSAIVIPKDSTITDVAGLKGKKVGVAKGSSAHYHLVAALKKANLTLEDIQVQYLQPPDASPAFSNGSIEAWAIWDPFTAVIQTNAEAKVLVDGTGIISGYAFQVAAPGAVDDKAKGAAIQDYLTRLGRARAWALTHKIEWAQAWAKETGLPEPVARKAVDRNDGHAIAIDAEVISTQQKVADVFFEAKLIPNAIKPAEVLDGRFNDILKEIT